jgi:hypothetical protein
MKIPAVAVFALLLCGLPLCATVITFEDLIAGYGPDAVNPSLPKGTVVTTQYLTSGVVFSSSVASSTLADLFAYVSSTACCGFGEPSVGKFLAANTAPEFGKPGTLTIQFVKPGDAAVKGWVNATASDILSFWVRDDNGDFDPSISVGYILYDVNGAQLASGNLASFTGISATPSWNSLAGVSKIVLTDMGADGFQIDNLTFGPVQYPQEIPEPGTVALLGTGILGLAFASTRLRSRG